MVFSFDESAGVAKWNYVELGAESGELVIFVDGISKAQMVIIEGNLNLAHDEEVEQFAILE